MTPTKSLVGPACVCIDNYAQAITSSWSDTVTVTVSIIYHCFYYQLCESTLQFNDDDLID